MRQRHATSRASDRSNERHAGIAASKRALLTGASVVTVVVVLVVCCPRRWVAATDSTDAHQRAAEANRQSTIALHPVGSRSRASDTRRGRAAELSDPAAEDAAASGNAGAAQPTRVAPSASAFTGEDTGEQSRSSSRFGGNTFGFDFFTHIGQRSSTRPPDGPYLLYHPEGGVAVEGLYENGEREGDWASYYPDGSLRLDGQYVDGKREGHWKAYHPSGQPMGEGEYSGGLREGLWVLYYSNGLIKEQGVFEHDLRHGPWQYYDGFGELEARSGFYRYGRLL
jgi:hypothetical protein